MALEHYRFLYYVVSLSKGSLFLFLKYSNFDSLHYFSKYPFVGHLFLIDLAHICSLF